MSHCHACQADIVKDMATVCVNTFEQWVISITKNVRDRLHALVTVTKALTLTQKKASSFVRSAAVQVPDQAGLQYVIFATEPLIGTRLAMKLNTMMMNETVGIPRLRNTRRANNKLLFTWSVALSRSFVITPSTFIVVTRSMSVHGIQAPVPTGYTFLSISVILTTGYIL